MRRTITTIGILLLVFFNGHNAINTKAQDSIFPMVVVPPAPIPPPPPIDPKGILTLTPDRIYVAKSTTPFFLIASPQGAVDIKIVNGPIAIYGLFADTPNKTTPELRTFTEPHVRIVTPLTAPTANLVELIAVIEGIKSIDQLQRVTLQLGPIPPPVPPIPPGPTPPGPTPPPVPVTEFRVIFIYDMAKSYPAPVMQTMNSKAIRDYLTAKTTKENTTPEWRFWDVDAEFSSKATKPLVSLYEELKPKLSLESARQTPYIMIRKNGKSELIVLPENEEKTLSLLQSYGGV